MFNLGGDFVSLALFDNEFQAFHERPRGLTTDLESLWPQVLDSSQLPRFCRVALKISFVRRYRCSVSAVISLAGH